MKRRAFQFILGAVVVVTAAGAFFSTRAQMSSTGDSELGQWLGLSGQQRQGLEQANADFAAQVQELKGRYEDQRRALAALFADPNCSENDIYNQVKNVLASNDTLTHCVVRHILDVREHLTEEQRRQFVGLCCNAMRGPGRGRRAQSDPNATVHRGRGYGYGQNGRGRRGQGRGARFGRHLAFTAEQETAVAQLDPNFTTESEQLTEQLQQRHQRLSQLLEDPQAERTIVLGQLDTFIAARSQFEQRTTDHLLLIRHLLTPDQMQRLLGLCDSGHRYRRGWSR